MCHVCNLYTSIILPSTALELLLNVECSSPHHYALPLQDEVFHVLTWNKTKYPTPPKKDRISLVNTKLSQVSHQARHASSLVKLQNNVHFPIRRPKSPMAKLNAMLFYAILRCTFGPYQWEQTLAYKVDLSGRWSGSFRPQPRCLSEE